MQRRDFLKGSLAAGAALAMPACSGGGRTAAGPTAPRPDTARFSDPSLVELADLALQAAREAGASYADIRIADYRRQTVATREARVLSIRDSEDRGFGVRVIAGGTWGFAASARVTREEVVAVARRAVAIARANSALQREPVALAPVQAHVDTWRTPIEKDPFDVPAADKVERLLAINAEALKVPGVTFCSSSMGFVREHKFFASTEGSYIEQWIHRCNPGFTVTSVDRKRGSFQSRDSYSDPRGVGYEYIEQYPWFDDARQAGEDAVAKHTARPVEPGPRDLILHPTHLWLTIHESIGHSTELDRALGMEANYAGTSFLTLDKRGSFELGSPIVNFVGEKTAPGSLATCGYDDDGVKTTEWPIVKEGVFVDYQTTRDQAHLVGRKASHGTCYAESWSDVPFQRMPNVNLLPGASPLSEEQLIADTEDGILIKGRGSYSIDHQRYNFQFGGQAFYEIKRGKVTGMLRDVAYQARTPDFWRACDAICDRSAYYVGGSFYDGKGEPSQSNAVSHGCSTARFRKINVINTARQV
ncbi:MAG TPA: TldD/PmbA family protein [Kofleriaceae bacterium]|nr:TldD/PmbA family protein [Kofleriaceae bacterium]